MTRFSFDGTSLSRDELAQILNQLLRDALVCVESGAPLFVNERNHRVHPFESEVNEPYGGATLATRSGLEVYIKQLTVRLLRTGMADADILSRIAEHFEKAPAPEVRKQLGAQIPRAFLNPQDYTRKLAAIGSYDDERKHLESQFADEKDIAINPVIAAYDSYFRDDKEAETEKEPSAFKRHRAKPAGFGRSGSWGGREGLMGIACTRASKSLVDVLVPLLKDSGLEHRGARQILEDLGFDRGD